MIRAPLPLTPLAWSNTNSRSRGFSLVEVVLAGTILALLATAVIGAFVLSGNNASFAARRVEAILLAEEGLEATRNIRDANFALLEAGSHGLTRAEGIWMLNGASDITGEFMRVLTIADLDPNRKAVTSRVTWQQNAQRQGEISVETTLTNWITPSAPPASCPTLCQVLGYGTGTCRPNAVQCTRNGEVYEPSGDPLCSGGPSTDTCCCRP